MSKTAYQKKIDKILTPEVMEAMRKAENVRFLKVQLLIEDESEEFLEKLKEHIQDILDECYSIDG